MDDKQQKMFEWLTHRIIYVMDQGNLTEQHCLDAVAEADKKLKTIREERL